MNFQKLFNYIFLCMLFFQVSNIDFAKNNSPDLSNILPNALKNYKMDGEPIRYSGDDLFFLIDGGAELYLEYGFVEVISTKYVNAESAIKAEIYEMSDNTAAFGIYTSKRYREGSPINIGDMGSILNSVIIFWKDNYLVVISDLNDSENTIPDVKLLAREIESNISASGEIPEVVNLMPPLGQKVNSLKYIKGMIGLNSAYIFGHTDFFGFDDCVFADYENFTLFIMDYSSPGKCESGFETAFAKFSENKKYSGFTDIPNGKLFKDRNGKILSMQIVKGYLVLTISQTEIDQDKVVRSVEAMM